MRKDNLDLEREKLDAVRQMHEETMSVIKDYLEEWKKQGKKD
jgi:hypothetical protein